VYGWSSRLPSLSVALVMTAYPLSTGHFRMCTQPDSVLYRRTVISRLKWHQYCSTDFSPNGTAATTPVQCFFIKHRYGSYNLIYSMGSGFATHYRIDSADRCKSTLQIVCIFCSDFIPPEIQCFLLTVLKRTRSTSTWGWDPLPSMTRRSFQQYPRTEYLRKRCELFAYMPQKARGDFVTPRVNVTRASLARNSEEAAETEAYPSHLELHIRFKVRKQINCSCDPRTGGLLIDR
jgi:hypothetical protein